MSRATVLNTIEKLNHLLDEEAGVDTMVGGGGRKAPRGGAMIPYGSGLQSYPAPLGYGYLAGKRTRKADGTYANLPHNLTTYGRIQRSGQAQMNPWVQHVKQFAAAHNMSYADALSHHSADLKATYHYPHGLPGQKLPRLNVGPHPVYYPAAYAGNPHLQMALARQPKGRGGVRIY